MQQRTADLGGKPVLDASFTGSSQLSCKLINEAMAAPRGGPVLVSIGTSTGTGLGQTWTDTDLPWPDLVLGLDGLVGLVGLWAWCALSSSMRRQNQSRAWTERRTVDVRR